MRGVPPSDQDALPMFRLRRRRRQLSAALLTLGLLLATAFFAAPALVRSGLESLATEAGLQLTLGGVSMWPPGRFEARELTLRDRDGTHLVDVASLQAIWSARDAIRLRRVPTWVVLDGIEADVRIASGRPQRWPAVAARLRLALARLRQAAQRSRQPTGTLEADGGGAADPKADGQAHADGPARADRDGDAVTVPNTAVTVRNTAVTVRNTAVTVRNTAVTVRNTTVRVSLGEREAALLGTASLRIAGLEGDVDLAAQLGRLSGTLEAQRSHDVTVAWRPVAGAAQLDLEWSPPLALHANALMRDRMLPAPWSGLSPREVTVHGARLRGGRASLRRLAVRTDAGLVLRVLDAHVDPAARALTAEELQLELPDELWSATLQPLGLSERRIAQLRWALGRAGDSRSLPLRASLSRCSVRPAVHGAVLTFEGARLPLDGLRGHAGAERLSARLRFDTGRRGLPTSRPTLVSAEVDGPELLIRLDATQRRASGTLRRIAQLAGLAPPDEVNLTPVDDALAAGDEGLPLRMVVAAADDGAPKADAPSRKGKTRRPRRKKRRERPEGGWTARFVPMAARLAAAADRVEPLLRTLGRRLKQPEAPVIRVEGGRLRVENEDGSRRGGVRDLQARHTPAVSESHLRATLFDTKGPCGALHVGLGRSRTGHAAVMVDVEGPIGRPFERASTLASARPDGQVTLHATLNAVQAAEARGGGEPGGWQLRLRGSIRGVGIKHRRLAPVPLDDFALRGQATLRYDPERDRVWMRSRGLRLRALGATDSDEDSMDRDKDSGARLDVDAGIAGLSSKPVVHLRVALPPQDCGEALAQVPSSVASNVQPIVAAGTFAGHVGLDVPLAAAYGTRLDAAFEHADCAIERLGSVDVTGLTEAFSRPVNEDGTLLEDVPIGPASGSWVPLGHMPRWVPFSMTTTEDGAFWGHEGLNLTLLERAIRLDLDYGRYVYGGSTITQQLVKNLYLTRSKHLARKFEELLIVWQMERLVPKRRILEVYTNGVEFGPKLYGVERASRYYFGKSVREIGPVEAAFLGATKPCPRCGHALFKSTRWGHWWRDRTVEVLNRMRRAKFLTQGEFEALYPYVPRFVGWPAARFAPNAVADLIRAMPAEKGLSVRDLLARAAAPIATEAP